MKKVKKIKIKPGFIKVLKIVGIILCILFGLFLFYLKQIHDLIDIGYSKKASQKILFSFQKDTVLSIGENKTLNAAFESDKFIEDNMDHYVKIHYVNHEHFILNINKLLKIGYSDSDINLIFEHGDDAAVTRFTKRDKIRYLEEFFVVDYAKLDNYDRYVKYSDETGEDEESTVLFVNLDMDLEDYQDSTLEDRFSYDMLVNKFHALSETFEPTDLITVPEAYSGGETYQANRTAIAALSQMFEAAKTEGLEAAAVADPLQERIDEAASVYGVPHRFIDWREMADSGVIDLAVIASPTKFHLEQCEYFMSKGKDVLIIGK